MIRQYREKAGYTQEQLAELLRISTRHLQRVENKESNPSITLLKKLITILNISDSDIAKIIKEDIIDQD